MATGAAASFPIYVSSSLDKAIVLLVSSDDTTLSLKRKLEQVHADLFPEIGEIIVKALKIKREEHVYHLSDSMPIKLAFNGLKGCYFLCMDAVVAPQQRARRMQDREPRDVTCLLQNRGKPVKEKKRNMSLQEITEPALCLGENSRNKRRKKQIKGPSSDRDYEVPPVREIESLKGGDNVQENNMSSGIGTASEGPKGDFPMTGSLGNATFSSQCGNVPTETPHLFPSQLEKGSLVPEKDAISDEDTEPDNQLATEQTTAADGGSKESTEKSPRKKELFNKTAHTSSVNPGIGSSEKRMRKETKATSLATSAQDILAQHNRFCKGKESNTEDKATFVAPIGKDQNGSSLNQGSDAICMAEPVKISSEAGAKNDLVLQGGTLPTGVSSRCTQKEKRRKKTEGSSSESPSDVPLAGERKYKREVQKRNVISEKETASKNTKRDPSIAGGPGEISSFALNGRDPKEGSLEEMNFSSQTQINEKASVPQNEFEEPGIKSKKKEKRKKVSAPEAQAAGFKAESQTKNPHKGKSKEREGRIINLSDDVPKGDGIAFDDNTEDEDELGQFRVEFRNTPLKKNVEKTNALEVEEKASGSSTKVFPVQQCRVSGGNNWRCKEEALPGKRICAYHESRRQNKASRQNRTLPAKRR